MISLGALSSSLSSTEPSVPVGLYEVVQLPPRLFLESLPLTYSCFPLFASELQPLIEEGVSSPPLILRISSVEL